MISPKTGGLMARLETTVRPSKYNTLLVQDILRVWIDDSIQDEKSYVLRYM